MHELGYTRDILDTVISAAGQAHAREVRAVYLAIGEARDIVDDLFIGCFNHFARNTIAEHASLKIERVPLTVRCSACGTVYGISVHGGEDTGCPACGGRDFRLASGMEFKIDRVEVA